MYLDEIVDVQKRGETRGITSICSAHPWVLSAGMQETADHLLIEATCNQANQFGGYTGMIPADFVHYVRTIAQENKFPFENIILGGDHLGPSVWQNEPAESAMQKAEVLVRDYVEAGFIKIHLDCSMPLADDPDGDLDVVVSARRVAGLAKVAEMSGNENLRYVIGTEVPLPGGAIDHKEGVILTKVEDVQQTIEVTREAFLQEGLESVWDRVLAVVVQPGVEFGDDYIINYQPETARDLVCYFESEPQLVYEAHSTDYQMPQELQNLVRDHFAILKVGPALTFAFREAVFALVMMENELFPQDECSNLISVLEEVMVRHPEHWENYYRGTYEQCAYKRKYSLSDRVRYYWTIPKVQLTLERLLKNLEGRPLPLSLVSQFLPVQYSKIRAGDLDNEPGALIWDKINNVLDDYDYACG